MSDGGAAQGVGRRPPSLAAVRVCGIGLGWADVKSGRRWLTYLSAARWTERLASPGMLRP